MDLVEGMMNSTFMATISRAIYICYIRVDKTTIKHQCVLSFHLKLGKDTRGEAACHCVLGDSSFYISSVADILYMAQAADELVKKNRQPAPRHANAFYRNAMTLFDEPHACHLAREEEKCPILEQICDTKIQQTQNSHSLISLFISTMRPFQNEARGISAKG